MALFDQAINFLTRPEILFGVSVVLFLASIQFAEVWTRPKVALGIAAALVAFTAYGATKPQLAYNLARPDNLPILILIALLGFLYWLAMRQAVENDRLIEAGKPPKEAQEKNRKVLVWPDLVYIELIMMVVATVVLVAWSMIVRAPLEEPANAGVTPNPAKAPWYFLGLQELVHYGAILGGVVVPTALVLMLLALPYLDAHPRGVGVWFAPERRVANAVFASIALALVAVTIVGTFFRGPNWAWVWPW